MLRSEQLNNELAELRDILSLEEHPGWRKFIEKWVEPAEDQAYALFKGTPIENTAESQKTQIMGNVAEEIRTWPSKHQVKADRITRELQDIGNKEQEDFAVEEQEAKSKESTVRKLNRRRIANTPFS